MRKFNKTASLLILSFTFFSSNINVFATTTNQNKQLEVNLDIIDQTMHTLLDDYTGGDIDANTLYEGAMDGISSKLDNYSYYLNEANFKAIYDQLSESFFGIGVGFDFSQENKLIATTILPNSPAEKNGIKIGDVLTKINNIEVNKATIAEAFNILNDDKVKQLELTILRDGKEKLFKITKDRVVISTVFVKNLDTILGDNVIKKDAKTAYISISQMSAGTSKEFKKAVATLTKSGYDKLILDLRGNPGGMLSVTTEMSNLIVPKGIIFQTVDKNNKKTYVSSSLLKKPFKKIVVLMDRNSASAAELFASAIQESGAGVVVGEQSYGKGIIQKIIPLDNDLDTALKYTYAEYLTRNGNKINKIGVTPDFVVNYPPLINGPIVLHNDNTVSNLPEVKDILKYLGYKVGPSDTVYDEITKKSVIDFQTKKNFNKTGILDYETILKLNEDAVLHKDIILLAGYEQLLK